MIGLKIIRAGGGFTRLPSRPSSVRSESRSRLTSRIFTCPPLLKVSFRRNSGSRYQPTWCHSPMPVTDYHSFQLSLGHWFVGYLPVPKLPAKEKLVSNPATTNFASLFRTISRGACLVFNSAGCSTAGVI